MVVDGCDPHEGWYKVDVGYNQTSPALQSAALPITAKMQVLGVTETAPSQANPAALDRAMREFTGPLPLGSGLLDCTPNGKFVDRVQPGSCVRFVDLHQFVDGVDLPPVDLGS